MGIIVRLRPQEQDWKSDGGGERDEAAVFQNSPEHGRGPRSNSWQDDPFFNARLGPDSKQSYPWIRRCARNGKTLLKDGLDRASNTVLRLTFR